MRPETLFISDLHLTAARPATVRRFLHFLEHQASGCQALYILGDLFDAYIGDDNHAWPFAPIKSALAKLTRTGTRVYFQPGNRDFLLGERFCSDTGAVMLGDYAVIDLYGEATLVTHGDLLCTDDHQYQAARQRIRTAEWKAHALAKPLWLRRLYARWYRFKSGLDKRGKEREIMDVNEATVREVMHRHGVRRLIHGHTHRPGTHVIDLGADLGANQGERWVLPEWNGSEWILTWKREGPHQPPLLPAEPT
jgi:UDP-2,3-diacylglucosamine hydrolase